MPQTDDILQQAILDVNKIKQVSLQVAKEKLHQQYSNDLRKKYIKEMNDNFGSNDDITLFEDVNDLFGEDDPNAAPEGDTPGEIPGQAQPGEPTPGVGGSSDGLTPPAPGENGLPPQAGAVSSPVMQSDIPVAGVDDESNGSVIVLNLGDGDSPFDLEASEADLKAQTSELLAGQGGVPPQDPNSMIPGAMPPDEAGGMLPPDEQGRRTDNDSIFAGIFDEEEDPYLQDSEYRMEGALKVSDEILLEYIQKSLHNDEKFNSLTATIEKLQTTVDNLAKSLNKSNSDLLNLKEQNIRLMYKNQALNDDSLSEPQKQSIVKALDKAKTLNEAKAIYETAATSFSKTNNKPKDVNAIISDNVTRKFLHEGKQPVTEEKVELTSITKKLFEKWGI